MIYYATYNDEFLERCARAGNLLRVKYFGTYFRSELSVRMLPGLSTIDQFKVYAEGWFDKHAGEATKNDATHYTILVVPSETSDAVKRVWRT